MKRREKYLAGRKKLEKRMDVRAARRVVRDFIIEQLDAHRELIEEQLLEQREIDEMCAHMDDNLLRDINEARDAFYEPFGSADDFFELDDERRRTYEGEDDGSCYDDSDYLDRQYAYSDHLRDVDPLGGF